MVALAAAAATAAAGAAGALPDTPQALFERIDADRDGRVSLAEYQAWLGRGFRRLDRDGDGVLQPHELPGGGHGGAIDLGRHERNLARRFQRQDADGDGYLDLGELVAPPR